MKTNKEIKNDIVSEIESNIESATSLVAWKYHGMSSNDISDARIDFKKNADLNKVYKNRLFKIALENKGKTELNELLIGPNSFLFLNSESQESLKVINKFVKSNKDIEFTGGYIEGKFYTGKEIAEIADLPTKPEMISMLLSVLQAPMRNAAYAISQINPEKNSD